ncbi:unnamed protein product (macronuclear) [Paramecium tetraurelia]|uniref:Peptidase M16 middle/third domain-containing protein n=1 Tax=Paramecium tetraurelia TaxID=5888 RepID=A0BNN0_PARTE|nr:uncharacterized protein GSPATT00030786001 [Paramecium tetraurelia]CAK60147.1 unnamed protein product [Paramecium tetraurelia]|eukprot:XP_001427545.1 hypothetical protein (macronuclear) [Paramecium tetraurelia strain d4-2]
MLFIGSEKYPQTEFFEDLMAKGGGIANAYTDDQNTNYYFEITVNNLGKALDVFAHFFIDPLFNEDAVNKERNAVNSEYEIDVSSEEWKVINLFALLADPNHPASRFSIGNNEVLAKDGVVEALKKFYKDNYSSNIMSLAVSSRLSLNQMEKLIKVFSKIENKNLTPQSFSGFPYQFGLLGKYKTEKKLVFLNWQLSGRQQIAHQKPLELIDYLLNNGNLKDYLKEKQLAIEFESSIFLEQDYFVNYIIQLTLPEHQLEDGNIALEISRVINNYIQQLEEWLKDERYLEEIFKEQSQISKISFEYKEGPQEISSIAHNLNRYEPAEVLSSSFIMDVFDKDLIFKYISELKRTDNLLILIGDDEYQLTDNTLKQSNQEFLKDKRLDKRSEIYRLEYATQKMTQDSIQFITQKDIKLQQLFTKPQENLFIPDDLKLVSLCESNKLKLPLLVNSDQLKPLDKEGKLNLLLHAGQDLQEYPEDQCKKEEHRYQKNNHYPILLSKENNQWWKFSTLYKMPTVYGAISIQFANPLTIRQYTSVRIYKFISDEEINNQLRLPLASGYTVELGMGKQIELKAYGFSEKIRSFFKKICGCMNPFKDQSSTLIELDETQQESQNFIRAKQSLITSIKDKFQMKLFDQSISLYLPQILRRDIFNPEQVLQQIPKITEEQMISDIKEVLQNSIQSSLLIGNLDQKNAQDFSSELQYCIKDRNSKVEQSQSKPTISVLSLKGKNLVFAKFVESDKGDLNGAILNYYQIGKRTSENYALMKILQPLLYSQAYSYLRTDLQLGYVVFMRFQQISCIDGAFFLVQGNKELPMKVNQLIEKFILKFDVYLKKLKKKQFDRLRRSAIIELREKPQTLSEEADRLWEYISSGDYSFEERDVTIEIMKSTTKEQMVEFYENIFIHNRSKLSIQLYGEGVVSQTLSLKNNEEFDTYIQANIPKGASLFNNKELSYLECQNDVSSV